MVKDDYIYLIWQDPKSRKRMVVGELLKKNGYKFFYTKQFEEARKLGWKMLKPFPENREYESDVVFPVFSSRLPDRKRRDIDDILKEYGLKEYDEYELLKKSGAKLPIDSYEFVDPIFPSDETIQKKFYISGVRHYGKCNGKDCSRFTSVQVGDELKLVTEPDNEFDSKAVCVFSKTDEKIGYVPSYYSEAITDRLNRKMSYSCIVLEVNSDGDCRDCVKVELKMPKESDG